MSVGTGLDSLLRQRGDVQSGQDIDARLRSEDPVVTSELLCSTNEINALLREMTGRLVRVQESERRRLARDLHDEIGQLLAAARMHAEWIRKRLSDGAARQKCEMLIDATERALHVVRNLSLMLRPPQLDKLGLVGALRWQIDTLLGGNVLVALCTDGYVLPAAHSVQLAAYRIVQESLTNVTRHAGAERALVQVKTVQNTLVVRIVDNGRGFDVGAIGDADGLGIAGMRERATLLGGMFDITSGKGTGTRVTAQLPLIA
jgi:signal transduction histidine kinase